VRHSQSGFEGKFTRDAPPKLPSDSSTLRSAVNYK
jgi:hypothetical protein